MKNLYLLLINIFFYLPISNAEICISYHIENKQIVGSDFLFDIYINTTASSSDNFFMGNSDLIVLFNTANFTNPSLTKEPLAHPVYGINVGYCTFSGLDTLDITRAILRNNYNNNTVTQIISNEGVINVLGPTPSSVATFNSSVANIDESPIKHRLGRFKISGFTGSTFQEAGVVFKNEAIGFKNKLHTMLNVDPAYPEQLVTCASDFIFDVFVFLEGPYDESTGRMNSYLNKRDNIKAYRGLLPGLTPYNPFVAPTPPGQPYQDAPWGYDGDEGDEVSEYPASVVDWVLVSFRPEIDSIIWRTAAWIHENGRVSFLNFPSASVLPDSAYLVIQHRNHLAIMSPEKIAIDDQAFGFDFTQNNSKVILPGVGQKQVSPGVYAMYSGDGDQISDLTAHDINGQDNMLWSNSNGAFDTYHPADFNLSGDLTGNDKLIWNINNGLFTQIPK